MPYSNATVTHSSGMTLGKGDGSSPETFTTISGIQDMPSLLVGKSVMDRTEIGNTNRKSGLGIGEPPQFSLSLFWDDTDAQQTGLITEHDNGTESNYRITCPDSPATTYTFKAIIPSYTTPYAGVDGDLMWDVTFQCNENDDGNIITKA